jgi:hydroxymethylbilane synthase
VRVVILSRRSALARAQAERVAAALAVAHPGLELDCVARAAAGDRDQQSPLWQLTDKGAFTADLSDAMLRGEADVVVHSWKDLPVEPRPGTMVRGVLERADPRDVLLLRRTAIDERPAALRILTSSPRRAWLAETALPALLPWRPERIATTPVRGNIETRVQTLERGGDGLIVAKAALDRLLASSTGVESRAIVRRGLSSVAWMVLPMRDWPWAPAQGALAAEFRADRPELAALIASIADAPAEQAVLAERETLAQAGGGCHEALGVAVVHRPFGRVVSIRARDDAPHVRSVWRLDADRPPMPPAAPDAIWPRRDEVLRSVRTMLPAAAPDASTGLWVTRADALPGGWADTPDRLVWASGPQTWERLAARGVWVHGSADGLGDDSAPPADALAGRFVEWVRLTHESGRIGTDVATYRVDTEFPADLPSRTHFFWMSGHLFAAAMQRWPELKTRWHGSGPGRTHRRMRDVLGAAAPIGVWLDRHTWERDICHS